MSDLLDLSTREAIGLVLALLVPILLVGAGASLVAGWVAAALGVRDSALAQSLRALAVLIAVGMLIDGMAAATTKYAQASWSTMSGTSSVGTPP